MYYCHKAYGYVLGLAEFERRWKSFRPPASLSTKWKHWLAHLDIKTCMFCRYQHGQIYSVNDTPELELPAHLNCRCDIVALKAILAGFATVNGTDGADYWRKYYHKLPDYYITKEAAKSRGWIDSLGNLSAVLPGKMIFGGIYHNKNKHLPDAPSRVWFEADINYEGGYRNAHRLLFSNDGLLFVTYDHYETFHEII